MPETADTSVRVAIVTPAADNSPPPTEASLSTSPENPGTAVEISDVYTLQPSLSVDFIPSSYGEENRSRTQYYWFVLVQTYADLRVWYLIPYTLDVFSPSQW